MKIKLTNVRLSFPDLWEAKQYQGQGPFNYRASFLFPKSGHPAKKLFDEAVKKVAAEKWGAKADTVMKGIVSDKQKYCLIDGDTKEYDGYADSWAIAATREKSTGRPDIRDTDGKTQLSAEAGRPYAGCYVDAIVEIWPQDNKFGKAIRAQLIGMQYRGRGDAFSGGAVASDDDFEEITEGADADDLS